MPTAGQIAPVLAFRVGATKYAILDHGKVGEFHSMSFFDNQYGYRISMRM